MTNSRLKQAAAASLMLCGLSFVATGSAWAAAALRPAWSRDRRSKASPNTGCRTD